MKRVSSINYIAKLRLEVSDKLDVGLGVDALKVGLQADLPVGKKAAKVFKSILQPTIVTALLLKVAVQVSGSR
jgi:hypothetical protein